MGIVSRVHMTLFFPAFTRQCFQRHRGPGRISAARQGGVVCSGPGTLSLARFKHQEATRSGRYF